MKKLIISISIFISSMGAYEGIAALSSPKEIQVITNGDGSAHDKDGNNYWLGDAYAYPNIPFNVEVNRQGEIIGGLYK